MADMHDCACHTWYFPVAELVQMVLHYIFTPCWCFQLASKWYSNIPPHACIVIYLKLLIIYVHTLNQFQKYTCMLIFPVCEKIFKYLDSMASNSPLAENHTNRCTYTENIVIEPFMYCLTHYYLYMYLLVQCPVHYQIEKHINCN